MKNYDFAKAKEIINSRKDEILTASLGMHEDWFWTAETIYEDGKYTRELNDGNEIAGINGSSWATPVLQIELKNGTEETHACHNCGESERKPVDNPMLNLGCLSGPCQNERSSIKVIES